VTAKEEELTNQLVAIKQQLDARPALQGFAAEANLVAAQRYKSVVRFAADNLEFGVHYDVLPDEQWKTKDMSPAKIMKDTAIKKFLKKSGAEMLLRAFNLTYEIRTVEAVETPDLYRYVVQSILYAPDGTIVGKLEHSASSEETKWKYRWFSDQDIEDDPYLRSTVDKDMCKRRMRGKRNPFVQYRVKNPELGDLAPTIRVIAGKRSLVLNVRTAMCITSLFEQPLEEYANAIAMKYDAMAEQYRQENEDAETEPKRPPAKAKGYSKPVQELMAYFDDKCKDLSLDDKERGKAETALFGDLKIRGWDGLNSDEMEMRAQEWIDINLQRPDQNAGESGGKGIEDF